MTTIDTATLKARWGWTTLATLIAMAVLGWLDSVINAASGYGILDLEFVNTAAAVQTITDAWKTAEMQAQIGFLAGFDYLYMTLYGFSLFYGVLAARESFAREPGGLRRFLTLAAFAPLAGAAFDVVENAMEARFLFVGVTDQLAAFTYAVTMVKFVLILIGLVLALGGVAGLAMGRLKRA